MPNQITALNGTLTLPVSTINCTRLREVPSLVSWLYCFNAYIAIHTNDCTARDMLTYSRLLIREALRHGSNGWLEYDRVFRRQISINPALNWNTLEPGPPSCHYPGSEDINGRAVCIVWKVTMTQHSVPLRRCSNYTPLLIGLPRVTDTNRLPQTSREFVESMHQLEQELLGSGQLSTSRK